MTVTPLQPSAEFQTFNGSAAAFLDGGVSDKPGEIAEAFLKTNMRELTSVSARDCTVKSQHQYRFFLCLRLVLH